MSSLISRHCEMAIKLCDMPIKLSTRLGAIAGYIETGASVADVGTDHGILPVWLAQKGLCRHIIASDISEGSLAAARRTAAKYNVADKITLVTAPGLTGIENYPVDTIVIAGLGGETIQSILSGASWVRGRNIRLIVQPQTKAVKLCLWLSDNGYIIRDSQTVRDRGKRYIIIMCQ